MALTEKQRRFVEAYMGEAAGNATEAARLAGYASPEGSASKNMGKGKILAAIAERQNTDPQVATRQDRQRFWTDTMNDRGQDMNHRLKASELLGKSGGDFVQRTEQSGEVIIRVRRDKQ